MPPYRPIYRGRRHTLLTALALSPHGATVTELDETVGVLGTQWPLEFESLGVKEIEVELGDLINDGLVDAMDSGNAIRHVATPSAARWRRDVDELNDTLNLLRDNAADFVLVPDVGDRANGLHAWAATVQEIVARLHTDARQVGV